MQKGRPKKQESPQKSKDVIRKRHDILMKFLNYCRDYNFVGQDYESDTQIADKVTQAAEETFNKIKSIA